MTPAKRLLIFACLFLGLTGPTQAFDRRIGARPMGMGDAYSALAGDVNALNYNPAGLALLPDIELSLEYANLYAGLDDGSVQENHLVYALPLPNFGGAGLAWNNRSLFGAYSENEFLAGLAFRPVADWPVWVGAAAKLFQLGYTDATQNTYFETESTKTQFGFDAGILGEILPEQETLPGLRAGLSWINLNQPDLGLHAEDRQPWEFRSGLGAYWKEWDAALDLVLRDEALQVHGGAEKWFDARRWAVRAGFLSGSETGLTWTLGGSFAFDTAIAKVRLNYAFNYSFGGIQETAGVHRLSLDFLLPPLSSAPRKTKMRKAAPQARTASVPAPRAASAAPSAKLTRIKGYLLTKIDEYLSLTQKVRTLKAAGAAAGLEAVEESLHQAAGRLIFEQDLIGFLRHCEDAAQRLREVEKRMPNAPQEARP